MSANHDHDDGLQQLVRALGEAMYNDPGDKPSPMPTTDSEKVIKAQLTENTGTHFLDSGMYGRHWEENQDNPPWERPAYDVQESWVTQNVYHHMSRVFSRDRTAVALEAGLYAYGHGPGEGDAWLTCMEDFASDLLDGTISRFELEDMGVPDEFIEDILGYQAEMRSGRGDPKPVFTMNTYNHEFGSLSQVLQGTNFGGPYAEYTMLQVHQGADVRGGYTGPRVYNSIDAWMPMEQQYYCERCGWAEAESVIAYEHEDLLWQPEIDPFELEEEGWLEEGDDDHPALEQAYENQDDGVVDGAVFHRCEGPIGNFGYVRV